MMGLCMKKKLLIAAFLLSASIGAAAWNAMPHSAVAAQWMDEQSVAWVEWISGIPERTSLAIAGAVLIVASCVLHRVQKSRQAGQNQ